MFLFFNFKSFYKHHAYHIVNPSYWPFEFFSSLSLITLGLISFFHSSNFFFNFHYFIFSLGFFYLLILIIFWVSDILLESNSVYIYNFFTENNFLLGVMLFILSEIMLFFSVFWGFFHSSLCPSVFIGGVWPPIGILACNPWKLPFLNTVLLVVSGSFVNSFYYLLKAINLKIIFNVSQIYFYHYIMVYNLFFSIILGFFFLCCQALEYVNITYTISDGIYGSSFYIATGLHGLHVLFGIILLIICYFRLTSFSVSSPYIGVTTAVWYWHFVDIVWLFLFVFVYVWS